jgi:hypothetical protein
MNSRLLSHKFYTIVTAKGMQVCADQPVAMLSLETIVCEFDCFPFMEIQSTFENFGKVENIIFHFFFNSMYRMKVELKFRNIF